MSNSDKSETSAVAAAHTEEAEGALQRSVSHMGWESFFMGDDSSKYSLCLGEDSGVLQFWAHFVVAVMVFVGRVPFKTQQIKSDRNRNS